MGVKWVEYGLYGWSMCYINGIWVGNGWGMGGIWVEYGWNGVDGMISIVKNGKFEIF